MPPAGARMRAEMEQQPAVLRRLLDRRERIVRDVAELVPRNLRGIVLVARGSSDHAAVYGRYVLEAATGLPVALAAPSLHTLYGVSPRYEGYLAVAVSQSGRTPEIVTVTEHIKETGAASIAITNEPDSPLAHTADAAIHLGAGDEEAVPATKTFTAQLAAFSFIAEALGAPPWAPAQWPDVPAAVERVLADAGPAEAAAALIGQAPGLITVGRGYLFGIALEAALKLKETTAILAQGYSAADLRHGPIAVVEKDFPVIAFRARGPAASDMSELVEMLRARGARVIGVGQDRADLPVPSGLPEAFTAFPAVVRAQQVAYALSLRRGLDPDRPAGLSKVTPTT